MHISNYVDCIDYVNNESKGLLALGVSNFLGRWWTGQINIIKAEDLRNNNDFNIIHKSQASLKAGITTLCWLKSFCQNGNLIPYLNKINYNSELYILVSGSDDGAVDVWQCESIESDDLTYIEHNVLHGNIVSSVDVNASNDKILSGSFDRSVILWNVTEELTPIVTFRDHESSVHNVHFSSFNNNLFNRYF